MSAGELSIDKRILLGRIKYKYRCIKDKYRDAGNLTPRACDGGTNPRTDAEAAASASASVMAQARLVQDARENPGLLHTARGWRLSTRTWRSSRTLGRFVDETNPRPCSLPHPNPKYFLFHLLHQIFRRMHGVLNIGKKDN
jgi:hypothetical protein